MFHKLIIPEFSTDRELEIHRKYESLLNALNNFSLERNQEKEIRRYFEYTVYSIYCWHHHHSKQNPYPSAGNSE
jgi:hypothetical protein